VRREREREREREKERGRKRTEDGRRRGKRVAGNERDGEKGRLQLLNDHPCTLVSLLDRPSFFLPLSQFPALYSLPLFLLRLPPPTSSQRRRGWAPPGPLSVIAFLNSMFVVCVCTCVYVYVCMYAWCSPSSRKSSRNKLETA